MRSTLGGFLWASGHDGFPVSHGSRSTRLPPGVRRMKVECPSHVIASFCMKWILNPSAFTPTNHGDTKTRRMFLLFFSVTSCLRGPSVQETLIESDRL